jgi:hypothetical protein
MSASNGPVLARTAMPVNATERRGKRGTRLAVASAISQHWTLGGQPRLTSKPCQGHKAIIRRRRDQGPPLQGLLVNHNPPGELIGWLPRRRMMPSKKCGFALAATMPPMCRVRATDGASACAVRKIIAIAVFPVHSTTIPCSPELIPCSVT